MADAALEEKLAANLRASAVFFGAEGEAGRVADEDNLEAQEAKVRLLYARQYADVKLPKKGSGSAKQQAVESAASAAEAVAVLTGAKEVEGDAAEQPEIVDMDWQSDAVVSSMPKAAGEEELGSALEKAKAALRPADPSSALVLRHKRRLEELPKPDWHAPWKLMRVIAGHNGWVRSVAVDVSNEWFVTGSADRTIKVWDLASGTLKLTLTGHISTVRGVAVSERHPYLFSVGEDQSVKCWDLEQNKVVRNYHGHLSGIYCVALHPKLDYLFTAGRDAVVRVWDMRTTKQVFCLEGHKSTIWNIQTQGVDPQVITASGDSTVRLWDLASGKPSTVLTHHKKGIRSLALSRTEFSFASGAPDNIKKWQLPAGRFLDNFSGHRAIINTMALNDDGVLVSGGDNGSMKFWDYKTGYCFQSDNTIVQPGSLQAEAGILASTFDHSGSRLLTCEADKSIKIWKEDEEATPETHPIEWKAKKQHSRW